MANYKKWTKKDNCKATFNKRLFSTDQEEVEVNLNKDIRIGSTLSKYKAKNKGVPPLLRRSAGRAPAGQFKIHLHTILQKVAPKTFFSPRPSGAGGVA